MKERPQDFTVPQFVLSQRPDGDDRAVHQWFWSETATGALVVALGNRMREDEDAEVKAVAFGIAR